MGELLFIYKKSSERGFVAKSILNRSSGTDFGTVCAACSCCLLKQFVREREPYLVIVKENRPYPWLSSKYRLLSCSKLRLVSH